MDMFGRLSYRNKFVSYICKNVLLRHTLEVQLEVRGVYMYPTTSLSHARSSSGYRVYSCLFNDCYSHNLT
jgi:hypothetical protein